LSSGEIWQYLNTFLVVTSRGKRLPKHSGERPGLVMNILVGTDSTPTQGLIEPKMCTVLSVRTRSREQEGSSHLLVLVHMDATARTFHFLTGKVNLTQMEFLPERHQCKSWWVALGKLRQEDYKFEASLGYIGSSRPVLGT
jgi:hypothetical protein